MTWCTDFVLEQKLGLFQYNEAEPWEWLSKLADLELAFHPHDSPPAEIQLARNLPAPPADVLERLLICRQTSVLDDLATIPVDRLITGFAISAGEAPGLIHNLQLTGLVTAVDKREQGNVLSRLLGRSVNATPLYDHIRLAPDWWQQFVRLYAAYNSA